MKVLIEINCEEIKDLKLHLSVIRDTLNKKIKSGAFKDTIKVEFEDSNHYGDHAVKIIGYNNE